ncbi:dehydrogenase/reductase SDR family member 13-like [Pseudonaja textilis]|uniref:dehydrogenase/reductase SDR family member 13-like n=1 Tax=Pseudonaja textilis TaxID=8673 RepID=UPI000EA8BA18|nr:dehydrogenase/reductase SDR family member 13-like [Pseudonaja textilis]
MDGAGAALLLLLGLYALVYYYFVAATRCRNTVSLRGKTVLITGGNAGIGKATAVDLARRGARVILACRDKARGESAMYDIRRESGNSEVILMILDLASLSSVRDFAQTFLASEPRLDILINNAGVVKGGQTADGFDLVFQVNHLGHFLLTHLLLDQLKRCVPSRIVILSSGMHFFGKIDFQTIHKSGEGMWKPIQSYCNSKLANILHARELAKRLEGTNVTCYAVHPGSVGTEIGYSCSWWLCWLLYLVQAFRRNCDAGAQTSIYCATEEGIESLSGGYFVDCHLLEPWSKARDDQLAKKLWEFSERLLGLTT